MRVIERAGTLAALAVFTSLAAACTPAPSAPPDAGPVALAPVAPPPPVPLPSSLALRPFDAGPRTHVVAPCRALVVQGAPSIALDGGAKPLAMNDMAAGWVTLGAADALTVTLPRTARELAFTGPGVVDPCAGTDEAWLARGQFAGSRGSGETPGAEQWIVTPFAVVRYGAAILDVSVDEGAVRASLKGGSGTVLPEGASTWQLLDATAPAVIRGALLGKAGAATSADRCTKATAAAKTLEDALLLPGATTAPSFGDLAMRANDAHVLARATCAIAKLRAELLADPGLASFLTSPSASPSASPRTR